VVEILERVVRDEAGRARFHYVIVDFLGTAPEGELRPASDAAAARFVPFAELGSLPLTDDLVPVIERAARVRDGAALPPYEPPRVLDT
jgi:ADP-ribose pyrophosphatase YjhB (NUDIX family)